MIFEKKICIVILILFLNLIAPLKEKKVELVIYFIDLIDEFQI
jgi:hypothetical protein